MFDHRIKHAAFGGGSRRRMFTMNLYGPTPTEETHHAAQVRKRSLFTSFYTRTRTFVKTGSGQT